MSGNFISETTRFAAKAKRRRRLRTGYLNVAEDLLIVWDAFSIAGSGVACALIRKLYPLNGELQSLSNVWLSMSLVAGLLAPLVLRAHRRESPAQIWYRPVLQIVSFTAGRVLLLFGLLLATFFLLRTGASLPRSWIAAWIVSALSFTLGMRLLLFYQIRTMEAAGLLCDRIAVVGNRETAACTIADLRRQRGRAVDIVGVFDDKNSADEHDAGANDIGALLDLGRQHALDGVILAIHSPANGRLSLIMHELKKLDVTVALCPLTLGLEAPKLGFSYLAGLPFIVIADRPISFGGLFLKAGLDKLVSAALLLAALPVMAAIAIAIKASSPGPVLFRQRRVGRNNAEFEILKFRTMYVEQGDETGADQTRRNDQRVTWIGRFLRTTSLDELPQLINVLDGSMSLVGPRPLTRMMRTEDRSNDDIIAEYEHRHRVKPGITGLAQINGLRGATETAEQVKTRVKHDLRYIDNWSITLDIWIILITPIKLMFDRQNAF